MPLNQYPIGKKWSTKICIHLWSSPTASFFLTKYQYVDIDLRSKNVHDIIGHLESNL